MNVPLWGWFLALALILVLLIGDIWSNRGARTPSLRRSVLASLAWISVSVAFGTVLGLIYGSTVAQQYFAGYLLEKALSIDNVFVFALLFATFAVPARCRYRVLYYGVVGALVLRGAFIAGGAALLDEFSWVFYVFGAVIVLAGARMLRGEAQPRPERNLVVRGLRHVLPMTDDYVGDRFVTRIDGHRFATPLLVALVAIETTDLVFALDSIPAIFGVTRDVFIVFTSNAFAVLGLRALYFVFADALGRFPFLRFGLAAILVFIGAKMLLQPVVHVGIGASLALIAVAVAVSIGASILNGRRVHPGEARPPPQHRQPSPEHGQPSRRGRRRAG